MKNLFITRIVVVQIEFPKAINKVNSSSMTMWENISGRRSFRCAQAAANGLLNGNNVLINNWHT